MRPQFKIDKRLTRFKEPQWMDNYYAKNKEFVSFEKAVEQGKQIKATMTMAPT